MHGNKIVGVLGQLVQSHDRALVNCRVFRLEVAHKGSHCTSVTKGRLVGTPHAAVVDGISQVATEPVIRLWRGEKPAISPQRAIIALKP